VLDRKFLLLNEGGDEQLVPPRQVTQGGGTFTILDGTDANGKGPARPNSAAHYYFQTKVGAPTSATFLDISALPENRLSRQGAQLPMANVIA
jgi:hypothetical protein